MKLYHYSKDLYDAIRTRSNVGGLTQEEIKEENERAKLTNSPGSYNDHVSFFFDPIPLKTIAKIFHNRNPFWKEGNKIYEYEIDTTSFNSDILFDIVETPYKVKTLDETEWVETEEFLFEYLKEKYKTSLVMGETGRGIQKLQNQIQKYKGKTEYFYLQASKRNDFEENIDKYAAKVPHVMTYPTLGFVKIDKVFKCVVGSDKRELFKNNLSSGSIISRW